MRSDGPHHNGEPPPSFVIVEGTAPGTAPPDRRRRLASTDNPTPFRNLAGRPVLRLDARAEQTIELDRRRGFVGGNEHVNIDGRIVRRA